MTIVSKNKMIVFGGCSDIETFHDAHEFNFGLAFLPWQRTHSLLC